MRSVDQGVLDALTWYLEPFETPAYEADSIPLEITTDVTDDGYTQYVYTRNLAEEFRGTLRGTLDWLFWDTNDLLPVWVRDFLLIHSGAVTIEGRGVLIPAEADVGKSTLVTALLHAGASYLSDEFGALDPVTRNVYPYPKKIKLDDDTLAFFPGLEERLGDRAGAMSGLVHRYVRPEDCGAAVAGPAPLGAVIFPTANREGPPRLEEVPAAEAILLLSANCRNLYRYADRGVMMLSEMCRDARAYRLSGGTPSERADALMDALG